MKATEKKKQYMKQYNKTHKEKIKKAQKKYYETHKDYFKSFSRSKFKEQQQEIERLNNIINSLEKWLNENNLYGTNDNILKKLNELKEMK